jgi:hypothetical protein
MRSRWQRSRGDDPQAPIAMRFIDMFMAALGSLVFLALLLVFLLPKTTQQGTNQELKKKLDDLTAENQQLRPQIPQTSQAGGANTEEKYIIKRWLGVFVMVRGCDSIEPEMYVRWGLEDFNKNGLNAKLVYAVSRAPGSYSVYVGLTDPRALGERECAIQPFYCRHLIVDSYGRLE